MSLNTSLPPWIPTRRRNRLPLDVYREPGTYFVTTSTADRAEWFCNTEVVAYCADALRNTSEAHNFQLFACCFMPDHLHMLVSTEAESDLVAFIKAFKQKTGYWFRNRNVAPAVSTSNARGGLKASPTIAPGQRVALWQRSFHDHVLRKEEAISDVVRYVLNNPAGLVEDWDEYPHTWSAFVPT